MSEIATIPLPAMILKQLRQYGFPASRPIEAMMLARYEQAKKMKP